jgi:hypothetical protein
VGKKNPAKYKNCVCVFGFGLSFGFWVFPASGKLRQAASGKAQGDKRQAASKAAVRTARSSKVEVQKCRGLLNRKPQVAKAKSPQAAIKPPHAQGAIAH